MPPTATQSKLSQRIMAIQRCRINDIVRGSSEERADAMLELGITPTAAELKHFIGLSPIERTAVLDRAQSYVEKAQSLFWDAAFRKSLTVQTPGQPAVWPPHAVSADPPPPRNQAPT